MRSFRTGSASALLLAAHACALGQQADAIYQVPQVPQVSIAAGADARRAQSTTTAIVVGRDELLRQGDASLADVLKRQPGITIDTPAGKPAAIRMRGMGAGYAALLLNGLPAPDGFALESLDPNLIERIEIRRVATAETSGQSMAGVVNVVLRQANKVKAGGQDEFKAGAATYAGRLAPTVTGEHAGRRGALNYALGATVKRSDKTVSGTVTEEGRDPTLLRRTLARDRQVEDLLELAPRLSWQDAGGATLAAQAYLRQRRYDGRKEETEQTDIGSPTPFPRARSSFHTAPTQAYAELTWAAKLDGGARMAAKLAAFGSGRDARFDYAGMDADERLRESHRVLSGVREREWTFSGSWRRQLGNAHLLALGWETGRKTRAEFRRERQADGADDVLETSDEDFDAQVLRSALFVQDEWDIGAAWSAYLGLRREDLRTRGGGSAHAAVDVRAGAWSPIMQLLYKPPGQDGLRFALSRTYKAPNIAQLMPRRYTVDNANSAANPDQQGNPELRPELALGVDLAWERTGPGNAVTSVSLFHKRIHDITLDRVYQNGGVWIVTPSNQGDASVQGVEFEARRTRGLLSARVNLARNWSRLDAVAGPDSHIAGQAAWSGNLGLDLAAPGTLGTLGALDLGGTWSYRGRVATRSSAVLLDGQDVRRQLDLYAVWKRGGKAKLRLSVTDLLHGDGLERTVYLGGPAGAGQLARTTVVRNYPVWRLVWEQSL